jgi:hypothetical protein
MGKLSGSKSVRNRKWLKRLSILVAVLFWGGWLYGCTKLDIKSKDEVDVPKATNSDVEILPMGIP